MSVAKKILVVEDEPMVLELIVRALVAEGYEVYEAKDGLAGWVFATREHVDLVITDTHMPEMSGPQLVELLRDNKPDLPIVHITGSPFGEAHRRYPPDIPTIRKPFRMRALVATVRLLLT